MNIETFNQAKEIVDQIDILKTEISVIQNCNTDLIRYGNNYNVSRPVFVPESLLFDFNQKLLEIKQKTITIFEEKLAAL